MVAARNCSAWRKGGREDSSRSVCLMVLFLLMSLSFRLLASFLRDDEEESEKSGTPSRARGRRGRSLALLTRLTAWSARLEPPLIHRQGGMNIYKKLREIVASLVLSRSCPRVVTAPVLLARARVTDLPPGCPPSVLLISPRCGIIFRTLQSPTSGNGEARELVGHDRRIYC